MKKILFLATAAMAAFGVAAADAADAPDDEEIKLEQEFQREEKRMAEMLKDEKSAAAWKESRRAAYQARYEGYQKLAQQTPKGYIPVTNPPDCTYYSTEGGCSLPRTLILPYPRIAHVNTRLDFRFPRKLADFEAQYIAVYPTEELGYSIKYIVPGLKAVADIFIYDLPKNAGSDHDELVRELRNVAAGISSSYKNVRMDEAFRPGNFRYGEKNAFLCFFAAFDSPGFNAQKENAVCQSFTLLMVKNRKFFKIRITRSGADRKEFTNVVDGFLEAFDRKVILDSQTRTRKFERVEIPPVPVDPRNTLFSL